MGAPEQRVIQGEDTLHLPCSHVTLIRTWQQLPESESLGHSLGGGWGQAGSDRAAAATERVGGD